MKKLRLFFSVLMAATLALSFNACSDDEKTTSDIVEPDGSEEPDGTEPGVSEEPSGTTYHFDLVVTVGRQGGMGRDVTTLVRSVASLDADQGMIGFTGVGCEINTDYTMESIIKGKYYYQIPVSSDRFSKLQIENSGVIRIQEQPFAEGYTYTYRKYTHAWIGDNTLVIMAANGDANQVIWTKLNSDDMTILGNGTLTLTMPEDYDSFTTSGILTYRESDNKLYYFYYAKKGTGMSATSEPYFRVAIINPDTMDVESEEINNCNVSEMAGSAYGELLQNIVMHDESGNLYLAGFNDLDDMEQGVLLRINAGETHFDTTYNGFQNAEGKLLTVQYLGNNKAFAYSRVDSEGTGIDSYSHYYSILDLSTGTRERLKYDGVEIPYSSGRFSQRSAVVDGKVYFGVNTADKNPSIYIYDIATGSVEKGAEVEEGYYFEQIRVLED